MTRNGIVYNLKESPYKITIERVTYFFSSKNYMEKFLELYLDNRETINNSLTKRFKITVNFALLSDVVLYSKIEKRGFYLIYERECYTCVKTLILSGGIVIAKN